MNNRQIYLLGAGGHGSVVLDALLRQNLPVAGVLDPNIQPGQMVFAVPVLGSDDWLGCIDPARAELVNGIGANPAVAARERLYLAMRQRGFVFLALCHDSAVIGRGCELGAGSQVMAGAVLQTRVTLGENVVVNTRASIDHDCVLGEHAFIAPGATLCASVQLGASAFVGAGAVILPGMTIGSGSIVGAGAVVKRPVAAGQVVLGNPAVDTRSNLNSS